MKETNKKQQESEYKQTKKDMFSHNIKNLDNNTSYQRKQ